MKKERDFELSQEKVGELTSYLYFSSPTEEWNTCKTIIVLGSRECKYRIKRAFDLFGAGNMKYIVCGANLTVYENTYGDRLSEAAFMGEYLLERGVQTQDIFVENESFNTKENLEHAYMLMDEYNLAGKVGIVSAGFHMRRVKIETDELSLKDEPVYIPAYGPNTHQNNWHQSAKGRKLVVDEYTKTKEHEK